MFNNNYFIKRTFRPADANVERSQKSTKYKLITDRPSLNLIEKESVTREGNLMGWNLDLATDILLRLEQGGPDHGSMDTTFDGQSPEEVAKYIELL